MSWLFFFIFSTTSLNSIVVYSLLKKAGLEVEELLIGSLLCLLSACVAYDIATESIYQPIPKGGIYVED